MLRKLHVQNFKSLADFSFPSDVESLPNFVCLIGLNGSGKSTLLQLLDFASHLMCGDIAAWLESRNWKASDLTSQFSKKRNINIVVDLDLPGFGRVTWDADFNTSLGRCANEDIYWHDGPAGEQHRLHLTREILTGREVGESKVLFDYEGSIISQLRLDERMAVVKAVRDYVRSWKSLELMAPNLMRGRSRAASDMGSGGQDLAGFIQALPPERRRTLVDGMRELYPHLIDVEVRKVKGGWASLGFKEVAETPAGGSMQVSVAHANDGMLRVLAILAQTLTSHQILLFDEIENGINPELIGKVVDVLRRQAGKQVIVTTHSPLVLNYLPDDEARSAVQLLYRKPAGDTGVVSFFRLAVPRAKLGVLGPGEVMLDTALEDAARQAAGMV